MTELSDRELTKLLGGLEFQSVKRKRSEMDHTGIRRNICAFANDLSGSAMPGVICIGLESDGSCAGMDVDDRLLRVLARMRTDGAILPFPRMSVEKRILDGCEIAVITVQPSIDAPVRFRGRVWIGVGPTVQQATPDEERHLAERRPAADLPFDHRPSTASLADLDQAHIQRIYLPRAVAREVLEQNQRTLDNHHLRSLRLSAGDRPTQGSLIAFGNDPQYWSPGAYVQFLRFDGETLTSPIRTQVRLTGRLDSVLLQLDHLIQINITVSTDITSGPVEVTSPDYPRTAIRQLMHNAVLHRAYEATNTPVRFYWFSNRVEIQSPGGLFGKVSAANFGTGETDYRNPLIAEIMLRLGFARTLGSGLPLAKKALESNGNPPMEFEFSPARVMVTVRPVP